MPIDLPNLKATLIKDGNMKGYFLEDLEREFSPDLYRSLLANLYGQTLGVIGGRSIVYLHDLERFLSGGSIAD